MTDGAINLPQVIQQSGDVSRLQETVQRSGEQQQMAAGAEGLRQQRRERSSVQRSERTEAQNRVRVQGRKDQDKGSPGQGRQPRGQGAAAKPDDEPPASGGGVLDVVV